jgi:hypothetical protein
MWKSNIAPVVAMTALVGAAFVLNPSPARHREAIKEAIGERSPLAGLLQLGRLAAFASTYHSLGVASYTTAGEETLSIGAFGVVFVAQ